METPQFDLFVSRAARDTGIAKVTSSNSKWMECALDAIRNIPLGSEVTGEDIRMKLIAMASVGMPSKPHAWGALVNAAVRTKLITMTGEYRPMTAKASHARRTPVYRRT